MKTASFASTSLSATNPVIHVTASLFNVTRIENEEDFYFFGAPMTDRVISFIEHCDEERLAVGKALGIRLSPLLEVLNSFWPEKKKYAERGFERKSFLPRRKRPVLYGVPLLHGRPALRPRPCP